jgi:uncharacterized protein (DUF488 family)
MKSLTASALFTVHYEGLDVDAFVEALCLHGVRSLVDVRELPLSRKRGFSKTPLRQVLTDAGINYSHLPNLGCPKPIRDRYRADGDWAGYTKDFLIHLRTQGKAIRELATLTRATTTALMCFEADHSLCHRTYVARAVAAAGGPPVWHLSAKTACPDSPLLHAA